jgi:hypothetical protein
MREGRNQLFWLVVVGDGGRSVEAGGERIDREFKRRDDPRPLPGHRLEARPFQRQ